MQTYELIVDKWGGCEMKGDELLASIIKELGQSRKEFDGFDAYRQLDVPTSMKLDAKLHRLL